MPDRLRVPRCRTGRKAADGSCAASRPGVGRVLGSRVVLRIHPCPQGTTYGWLSTIAIGSLHIYSSRQ